jgi:hypothetical protein
MIYFHIYSTTLHQDNWSGWIYIIIDNYYPIDEDFNKVSPKYFIPQLRFEIEEVVKSEAEFCFFISYEGSNLNIKYHRPPDPPCYQFKSEFLGYSCNPKKE